MRKLLIGSLLVLVAATSLYVFIRSEGDTEDPIQLELAVSNSQISGEPEQKDGNMDKPISEGELSEHPVVFRSIYDREIEYSAQASAAADATMSHYPVESFVRWRPVDLLEDSVLVSDLLSDEAIPETLTFPVFADVTVTAKRTEYTVIESADSVIWRGDVVGSLHGGWVEVTVVRLEGSAHFKIRIFEESKAYAVLQTADMPDAYVAVEWTPVQ